MIHKNQIDSASKLGLHVETINSSNKEEWNTITEKLEKNEADMLIIYRTFSEAIGDE